MRVGVADQIRLLSGRQLWNSLERSILRHVEFAATRLDAAGLLTGLDSGIQGKLAINASGWREASLRSKSA